MGRIKIVCEGTSFKTKIIDEETGVALTNVRSLTIDVDAKRGHATAVLTLVGVPFEAYIEKENVTECVEQETHPQSHSTTAPTGS